ncbi:MAG: shikimate dehydrogenase [Candidatus Micrarchaeia archaeon]
MKDYLTGNKTKLFCIIGDPARHSLSPAMHNAAFSKLGIDAFFTAFDVSKEDLKISIEAMKSLGISGMTITSPHKNAVIKYIDKIDKFAKDTGAVNTIINKKGILFGYNTDGPGFYEAIRRVSNPCKRYLIIGAGGAARAFIFEILAKCRDSKIIIANRTLEHAIQIKRDIKKIFGIEITVGQLFDSFLKAAAKDSDIIANATNADLENGDISILNKDYLEPRHIVFDANYVPFKPKLLRDAESVGCKIITGEKLLLYQGTVAFELFTGIKAPEKTMHAAILKALSKSG